MQLDKPLLQAGPLCQAARGLQDSSRTHYLPVVLGLLIPLPPHHANGFI